jgi:HD-GYP domain-containing protein (c-di-GMP phosphodiesterase class II)
LADEDHVVVKISRGRFFLQDEKLRYRRENTNLINEMLHYFEKRKLPGLRFFTPPLDSSFQQILDFARLLNRAEHQGDPLTWLFEQLNEKVFSWIEIVQSTETNPPEEDFTRKEMARKNYAYALASVKEVSRKLVSQRRAGVRNLKRIVQNMVDLIEEDESLLLKMSTFRDYDDYTYTHSVNVSILALCLGKRIGLSQISLSRLGICGLVHDLGKLDIPREILNKPGKLTAEEFEEIERHPLRSVSQILKLRAYRDLKAKILLPPFEHHLKYDLSGYPRLHRKKPVSLFGRILTITDVFDAITSPRVYRPTPFSPDRALGLMVEGAGKDFDPILLKVFINMLGVYPVGTVLRLDTGEIGMVVATPEDKDNARPEIALLVPDDQGGYKKGKVVDLGEQDPQTGSFRRNIAESVHSSAFGIQAPALLF